MGYTYEERQVASGTVAGDRRELNVMEHRAGRYKMALKRLMDVSGAILEIGRAHV